MQDEVLNSPQEALAEIQGIMRRSGKFLSLSGLSGVWAGTCALVAAAVGYFRGDRIPLSGEEYYGSLLRELGSAGAAQSFIILVGLVTIVVAVSGAGLFTYRRSQRTRQDLWNATSRAMLWSMLAPLATGGILVLALWYHQVYGFASAITLIFYGLSLLAGGRYTMDEIRTLGYCQVLLGLFVAFEPGYGIDAWALGFGVLHILYGLLMFKKYGA